MRRVLAVVLLASTFVLSAIPGQAQSAGQFQPNLELRIDSMPAVPLVANGVSQPIVVHWYYTFKESTTPLLAQPTGSTTIRFSPAPACAAQGVVITGPASVKVDFDHGTRATDHTYDGVVIFQVAATSAAPGETVVRCSFQATADAVNSQIVATQATPVLAQVVVAYEGILSVNVPTTIQETVPGATAVFDIEVSNSGNSLTTLAWDLAEGDASDGWRPVLPAPSVLESANQGGAATRKVMRVAVDSPVHPGWNNDESTFTVKVTPVSTRDESQQGAPVLVHLMVRVRGCYAPEAAAIDDCKAACAQEVQPGPACELVRTAGKASPSVHPALLLALVGLGAAWARRRQR